MTEVEEKMHAYRTQMGMHGYVHKCALADSAAGHKVYCGHPGGYKACAWWGGENYDEDNGGPCQNMVENPLWQGSPEATFEYLMSESLAADFPDDNEDWTDPTSLAPGAMRMVGVSYVTQPLVIEELNLGKWINNPLVTKEYFGPPTPAHLRKPIQFEICGRGSNGQETIITDVIELEELPSGRPHWRDLMKPKRRKKKRPY